MPFRLDYRNNLINIGSVPLNYMSGRLIELTFHALLRCVFLRLKAVALFPCLQRTSGGFTLPDPQRDQMVIFCQPHIADRTRNNRFMDGRHGMIKDDLWWPTSKWQFQPAVL